MQQVNRSEELIPVQEKYALTIREASEYFSIGIKKMRREPLPHNPHKI